MINFIVFVIFCSLFWYAIILQKVLKANVAIVKHSPTSDTCSSFLAWSLGRRNGFDMCGALLAYPVLIVLWQLSLRHLGEQWISFLDAYWVMPLTTFSFFMGCKKHHDITLVVIAVVGIALYFAVFVWLFNLRGRSSFPIPKRLITFSPWFWVCVYNPCGSLLVIAHFQNFWLCRKSECDHSH